MPRTFNQLVTMIRRRLGWPITDEFVSTAELADMLLESRKELFDFMVSIHQGSYRLARATFPTVADQNLYLIEHDPSGAFGDLVGTPVERIIRVAALFDDVSVPLTQWQPETDVLRTDSVTWVEGMDLRYRVSSGVFFGEMVDRLLYVYPTPSNVVTLELLYNAGPLGTSSVSQTGIINDLENDEYLVLDCAIKCLQMEETDPSVFMAQKDRLIQRLQNEAPPLDAGQAPTIQDARTRDEWIDAKSWGRW